MADFAVSKWAKWCLGLGVMIPIISFAGMNGYVSAYGFWNNVMTQNVTLPMMYGSNPVACLTEFLRIALNEPMGIRVDHTFICTQPTVMPYRFIMLGSFFLILIGLYGVINPQKIASAWPTDWQVFNARNVRKKGAADGSDLKMENPEDRPINPKEGGF